MTVILSAASLLAGILTAQVFARDPGEDNPPVTTAATTETVQPEAAPAPAPAPAASLLTPAPAYQALRMGVLRDTKHQIRLYRKSAWRWQKMLGLHRTRFSQSALHTRSVPYAKWALGKTKRLSGRLHSRAKSLMLKRISQYQDTVYHWQMVLGGHVSASRKLAGALNIEQRYNKWRKTAEDMLEEIYPANFNQFVCIHGYEGAWNANTGNGYYGGLQMDLAFQSHYGAYLLRTKGTANNWTPLEQIVVAQKAHDSGRGFYPWPNTAHYCGLI